MKLLLVEDDALLARALCAWMHHEDIEVEWIVHGLEAGPTLERDGGFDGVILDLGLPDIDGETVLRRLRDAGHELPVIVMTAREQVQDRVRLLDLGADDFLVKPVHLDELAARLRAVRRRQAGGVRAGEALRQGRLKVEPASRSAALDGQHVPLTNREYLLLETLMRHKGRAVTRDELVQTLSGEDEEIAANNVDVHVHHLRRKLGIGLIRTVRGVGYSLPTDA